MVYVLPHLSSTVLVYKFVILDLLLWRNLPYCYNKLRISKFHCTGARLEELEFPPPPPPPDSTGPFSLSSRCHLSHTHTHTHTHALLLLLLFLVFLLLLLLLHCPEKSQRMKGGGRTEKWILVVVVGRTRGGKRKWFLVSIYLLLKFLLSRIPLIIYKKKVLFWTTHGTKNPFVPLDILHCVQWKTLQSEVVA